MRTSFALHSLKTVRLAALALVAALAMVVAPSLTPAAHAAYPEMSCTVSVTPQTVKSGGTFTVSGDSPSASSWSVKYDGKTDVYTGTSFSHQYQAPKTTKNKTLGVVAKCIGTQGDQTQSFDLKVLGSNQSATGGSDGELANTGGFSVWWLVAGGGALVIGSGLIVASRRRRPGADN